MPPEDRFRNLIRENIALLGQTSFRRFDVLLQQRLSLLNGFLGASPRSGDLCGSGTVSGQDKSAFGSILELAWRGTQPITLPNGEVRRFVEDGDEIILRARCARDGAVPIGFGDCRGVVEPAIAAG